MVEEALSFWTEIQRYEDQLAADPQSLSFAPLSELYRKLGLLDDAISVAKKGCELHPDFPGGFFALGAASFDKGLKGMARPALERVVQLSPENLPAQKLLGQLYAERGEVALAEKALKQVLRHNPEDSECELLLHSLSSAVEADTAEEEHLEEAEIIEDLTEVLEEPQEPATGFAATAAPAATAVPAAPNASFTPAAPAIFAAAAPAAPVAPAASVMPAASETSDFPDFVESAEFAEFSELAEIFEEDEPGKVPEVPEDFEVLTTLAIVTETAAHPSRDPLTTATLAELYVSQGFLDKAIGIYHELLSADPDNHGYRLRCTELKSARERQKEAPFGAAPAAHAVSPQQAAAPAGSPQQAAAPAGSPQQAAVPAGSPAQAAAPAGSPDGELQRWLENIRRRRDGL